MIDRLCLWSEFAFSLLTVQNTMTCQKIYLFSDCFSLNNNNISVFLFIKRLVCQITSPKKIIQFLSTLHFKNPFRYCNILLYFSKIQIGFFFLWLKKFLWLVPDPIGSQLQYCRDRPEYWKESWRYELTYCHSESRERPSANTGVWKTRKE